MGRLLGRCAPPERFDGLTRTQVIAVLSGVGACCCQIDFYVSLGSEDIDRR